MNNSRLFVGNLPYAITEHELEGRFSEVGYVIRATVMRDQATGNGRGFGFVEMGSPEDAQAAIEQLNDASIGGRRIRVAIAQPRPDYRGVRRNGNGHGAGCRRNGNGHDRGRGRREPRW